MAKNKRKAHRKPATGSTTPAPRASLSADRVVAILAGIGLLITAYLTWVAWFGAGPALCAEGSGCDLIQQSRWSRVLGLPVALWGFGVYALLLFMATRMPPRLKRWQRIWFVSLVGVAISLYLTVVGFVSLGALCPWCLASLATLSAIFLWTAIKRPDSAPGPAWGTWLLNSVVVTAVILGTLHVYYSDLLSPREDPRLEALAQHLTDSGALYYGAYWCPACQQQSRLFRGASDRLPYVECAPGGRNTSMTLQCVNAGVSGFPTWVINGRRYQEVLQPEELARRSGFEW
ncbi:vitamin K epoxide reductase family protein [Thioalkalivibrio sulfidiphilus]|uniref:Vitamin K epoxide reductase domain-containing protein n=1 Tax=Thioalkalivibrio sulfidiphilus (strain HL-EbGR7) TaxID=396588 RepID=B8GRW8_THISH|nr:vitamin K epoxide reductase family protein [Thioalkalivibrio sulfidiphilus]ACL72672.1 conserved hypothetical protein [Thioalkalivibrio sulfidiphilus HL-EbGr7]